MSLESAPLLLAAAADVALAVWLYRIAPRSNVHRSFAVFLLFWGWVLFGAAMSQPGLGAADASAWLLVVRTGLVLTFPAVVAFLLFYGRRGPSPRVRTAILWVTAVASLAHAAWNLSLPPQTEASSTPLSSAVGIYAILVGGWWLSRDLSGIPDPALRRNHWLVVLGFTLYPLDRVTRAILSLSPAGGTEVSGVTLVIASLAPFVLLSMINLVRFRTGASPWGLLATFGLVVASGTLVNAGFLPTVVVLGLVNLSLPALVTYGILRHNLFGIDARVRWTLHRGTVAAIFIATFFVVGEAAQVFFRDAAGSEYLGLVGAGLLIFAISPIQRVAERFAERTVPTMTPQPTPGAAPSADARAEASFRKAVERAIRDGVLTREEERDLVILASHLGIPPERAYVITDEVRALHAVKAGGSM